MRVFPVKKLPFAALLWISSPNKKYPITVILLYETSKAVHGLLSKIYIHIIVWLSSTSRYRQIVSCLRHVLFWLYFDPWHRDVWIIYCSLQSKDRRTVHPDFFQEGNCKNTSLFLNARVAGKWFEDNVWPGKAYHFLSGGDGLEEKVKLYFIYYGWAAAEKKSEESKVKFLWTETRNPPVRSQVQTKVCS